MPPPERQRLFFALWPDEPLRRQLTMVLGGERFRDAGGRAVAPEDLHITLRYLGALSGTRRCCAERVASAVGRRGGFRMELSHVGYWPGPRVAWLGMEETPAALRQLVDALETGLRGCDLPPERRPYHPHLTFLRKARPEGLPDSVEPLLWQVESFVLAGSVSNRGGVRYRVLRRWSLL